MKINLTKKVTKVAFPTDEHYPYQDDRAVYLAQRIVNDFDPDVITSGSDGLDFYTLSKYDKDPARVKGSNLQNEIDLWVAAQRGWMDAAPRAERIWLWGNHEDRLRRWLWRNPQLADLRSLKVERLLEFDALNIISAEHEIVLGNQLVIKHGSFVRKGSGYSAKAELDGEKYQISTITGHTHRGGSIFVSNRGRTVQAHEAFCLCDLDPEYVRNPDWQQGIVLAEVSSGSLSVEAIPFQRKGKTIYANWRGKTYRS